MPSEDAQTTPVHMRPCYRCQRYIVHFWQWEPGVVSMVESHRELKASAERARREGRLTANKAFKERASTVAREIAEYRETHPQDMGMHVCIYCASERWQKTQGKALFDVEIASRRH